MFALVVISIIIPFILVEVKEMPNGQNLNSLFFEFSLITNIESSIVLSFFKLATITRPILIDAPLNVAETLNYGKSINILKTTMNSFIEVRKRR